jgi:hypothetical protein
MHARDTRLGDNELGLGVVLGQRSLVRRASAQAARFYPFKLFKKRPIAHDTLADVPLVLAWDAQARALAAFDTRVDAAPRSFRMEGRILVEASTGSRFDLAGRCTDGALAGKRLVAVPGLATRWYGFAQTYREPTIYAPADPPA